MFAEQILLAEKVPLMSLRRARPAAVAASSLHAVEDTHTPKTSAKVSQPFNGAAQSRRPTQRPVPPATPAARNTSSFVRVVDTRAHTASWRVSFPYELSHERF